jgi:NAD(P)-dependent dehydrogenase (short-subunit alcohol dehydrogenase family)
MKGKTVVITGGNTGIGKEAAVGLAEQGARVIITSRDPARGEAAVAEIRERTGADGEVEVMTLDLASLASIREFAAALGRRQDHLDVLLNNAGAVLLQRQVTADGFERTFGVNHLGHFVLTDLLLDQLRASAPARVVNVSSRAHKSAKTGLDFEDLQAERKYQPFLVYGRSKLANIYFTRELARRLEGTGITTNSLHPGFVRSDFGRDGDLGKGLGVGITIAQRLFAIGPKRGARTSIYLASSPDVDDVSGKYFVRCKPAAISKAAADDAAARRLWSASEELVGAAP